MKYMSITPPKETVEAIVYDGTKSSLDKINLYTTPDHFYQGDGKFHRLGTKLRRFKVGDVLLITRRPITTYAPVGKPILRVVVVNNYKTTLNILRRDFIPIE